MQPVPQRVDDVQNALAAGLPRRLVLLLASACGLSVANIYYAQPLLDAMAHDFAIDPAVIGIIVTATQAGYACGLVFLVPVGDLLDPRRLIVTQGALSSVALVVVAGAPSGAVLLGALLAVGVLAVVIQVLVAFAAALAPQAERGRAVGAVTTGVVVGILMARVAAGALADLGGWRSVYLASAVLTLAMAGLLARALPRLPPRSAPPSYTALLRSLATLFIEDRLLGIRAVLAMLIFAAFNVLWSSLVLLLVAPPYALSHTEVGLFGLAGIAGALGAARAGRLADRGLGQATTGVSLALMLASWGLVGLAERSSWALTAGVVALNLAIQAVHVTNQSMILAARPDARNRVVGGYMVFYSIGSAGGAIASTAVHAAAGWGGVCALGAAISAAALVFWAATRRPSPATPRPQPEARSGVPEARGDLHDYRGSRS